MNGTDDERWLDPWLGALRQHAAGRPLLELGCGPGHDSARLAAAGFEVIAIELSPQAVEAARVRAPAVEFHCADLREAWPGEASRPFGAVLASLSLHYFSWAETERLVGRLHAALADGGLLLARFNSTRDHHFGASGHPSIEPDYFLVDGQPKRFFDRATLESLFGEGWQRLALDESFIDRYEQPKAVWTLAARRIARSGD